MFVNKLISGSKHRLCYLQAIDATHQKAWYIILIHPAKLAAFNRIDSNTAYKISDYGEVLQSGYGDAAPGEVLAAINKKYDCDFK